MQAPEGLHTAPPIYTPFILEVIKDAVLLVDKERFLFANRAFEEVFDFPWCSIAPQDKTTILLASERARFFQLVGRLIDGELVCNEALVDCMNRFTGPFLSKVTFRPYVDVIDNKRKCVCIFSDPLFYKKLLENTATLIGILEYVVEERDCTIFRANKAAQKVLGEWKASGDNLDSTSSSRQPSPISSRQPSPISTSPGPGSPLTMDSNARHSQDPISIPAAMQAVLFLDGKRLAKDLGFHFELDDLLFFENCRHIDSIHAKRFQVLPTVRNTSNSPATDTNAKRIKRMIFLESTITYLGRSLNNRSMFTIVAEDTSATLGLEGELEASRQLLKQQSTFVAKMIHELRTPLSGLLGMAGLLRSTKLTGEQSDFLKTLEVCGDSLFSLIGNILDLSNLERNQVSLAFQPFDVADCIEEALEMVSQQACVKNIELFYEMIPHPLTQRVIGDDMRVRQILLVLLSNAMKFTSSRPNSRIIVRACLQQQDTSGELSVHFSVQDQGIGISAVDQLKLFKVFSQANTGVSQTYGGSGLGLAVAKSLVELMGGKIWVESCEGEGSTFHFTIASNMRISQKHQASHDMQEEFHQKRVLEVQRSFAGKKALLLVKERYITHNLKSRLTALGLTCCDSATSLGDQIPDVVLADEDLPSSDHPVNWPNVPWIAVGWSRPVSFSGGQFLRKPIRSKQLIDALRRSFNVPAIEETMLAIHKHATRQRPPVASARYSRILIVDDNVLNRKIARHMIEQLGYQASCIFTASNGVEAIACIAATMFDIVFMDWEMPIMGGEEATRKIRQQWPGQSDKPYIIGATASGTEQARRACLESGMNAFLSKPLRFDTLGEAFDLAVLSLQPAITTSANVATKMAT